MQYSIHTRSQHSIGSSSSRFGGPDRYVAVTIAPDGVEVPAYLNSSVLHRRGIQIRYCGEGYSRHFGPRSMYGQAIRRAERLVASLMAADWAAEQRTVEMY